SLDHVYWIPSLNAVTYALNQLAIPHKQRGLLRLRPRRQQVAGSNLDGRNDLCRRYAAGRQRLGVHAGHRRQLAVVEFSALGDDDCLLVRAALAPLGLAHRRAVRRNSLCRPPGGLPPRLSRSVSRPFYYLLL